VAHAVPAQSLRSRTWRSRARPAISACRGPSATRASPDRRFKFTARPQKIPLFGCVGTWLIGSGFTPFFAAVEVPPGPKSLAGNFAFRTSSQLTVPLIILAKFAFQLTLHFRKLLGVDTATDISAAQRATCCSSFASGRRASQLCAPRPSVGAFDFSRVPRMRAAFVAPTRLISQPTGPWY